MPLSQTYLLEECSTGENTEKERDKGEEEGMALSGITIQ